eukprot:14476558-Ditylum_brightwellii.AAC.1
MIQNKPIHKVNLTTKALLTSIFPSVRCWLGSKFTSGASQVPLVAKAGLAKPANAAAPANNASRRFAMEISVSTRPADFEGANASEHSGRMHESTTTSFMMINTQVLRICSLKYVKRNE